MRLYNIFYICKSCLPIIKDTKSYNLNDDTYVVVVKKWGECKKSLDALRNIECFEEKISNLYQLLDWRVKMDDVKLTEGERIKYDRYIGEISYAAETLVNLCNDMEMGKTESGIDVKIPKCASLKEYMGYLKEIDFIFTQCPYLLQRNEEIKFNNVDVGSQWLVFAVLGASGTFYILNNLAKLVQKAIEIKSNIFVLKQQEEALEEMRQKNEVGSEVIDTFKKLKQMTMDKCVSELEGDIGELKDNEERSKVERSLESLAYLMDKGVEIYSSIETPKEIKVLFPFEKDTAILPDNIQKLIEDKNGTKDTDK